MGIPWFHRDSDVKKSKMGSLKQQDNSKTNEKPWDSKNCFKFGATSTSSRALSASAWRCFGQEWTKAEVDQLWAQVSLLWFWVESLRYSSKVDKNKINWASRKGERASEQEEVRTLLPDNRWTLGRDAPDDETCSSPVRRLRCRDTPKWQLRTTSPNEGQTNHQPSQTADSPQGWKARVEAKR